MAIRLHSACAAHTQTAIFSSFSILLCRCCCRCRSRPLSQPFGVLSLESYCDEVQAGIQQASTDARLMRAHITKLLGGQLPEVSASAAGVACVPPLHAAAGMLPQQQHQQHLSGNGVAAAAAQPAAGVGAHN